MLNLIWILNIIVGIFALWLLVKFLGLFFRVLLYIIGIIILVVLISFIVALL